MAPSSSTSSKLKGDRDRFVESYFNFDSPLPPKTRQVDKDPKSTKDDQKWIFKIFKKFGKKEKMDGQISNNMRRIPLSKSVKCTVEPLKKSIDDYEHVRKLGEGSFGNVHEYKSKTNRKRLAIKIMDRQRMTPVDEANLFKNEIPIHNKLEHPNILVMFGYFSDSEKVYILLELGKGTLFSEMTCAKESGKNGFDEKLTTKCIYGLIEAVTFCHNQKVIHRDLKPENVIVSMSGHLKLADFGFSTQKTRDQIDCGTSVYKAPEIGRKQYTEKVDVWAIGIISYEMRCFKLPFDGHSTESIQKKTVSGKFQMPKTFSASLQKFIKLALVVDPENRATLSELRNHFRVAPGSSRKAVRTKKELAAIYTA